MSGGSYNYLCNREDPEDLPEMADRLDEIAPGSLAARRTRELLNLWRDPALRAVWQAVEWEESHDGYDGQVEDALSMHERGEIYRGHPPGKPAEAPRFAPHVTSDVTCRHQEARLPAESYLEQEK